jgi:hypothetical protein
MFEELMAVTGERPFGELVTTCSECYRLCIHGSRWDHNVIRMERPLAGTSKVSRLVAHFVHWWPETKTTATTYEIALREVEWQGMDALLAVADFWNLTKSDYSGLDGAVHTLEAYKGGRAHTVRRWSPSAVPHGELFSVISDYMRRLAGLAEFEWMDQEIYERYEWNYVPSRRISKPTN